MKKMKVSNAKHYTRERRRPTYNHYNSYNGYRKGGYKTQPVFLQTTAIYDFTVEFCDRYIPKTSRTHDQMVQASRSGKQNIAEGYLEKSYESRLKLLGVARASLEELLQDYGDFLRQRSMPVWDKNSPDAMDVRRIVYNNYNGYNLYNSYKRFLDAPELAANAMICLINQTNQMLDAKLRWLEERFVKEGGFRENLLRKRLEYRKGGL